MERLAHAPELLDGPLDDPAALADNLRDLRLLNRALGGIDLSRRAIDALLDGRSGEQPVSLLDVGTGGADIPFALLADWRRRGRHLRVHAVDNRPEVLSGARAERPVLDRAPDLTLGLADGRALPYPDGAFDIAHASLVVHHLDPADAREFLRELGRVARLGVVVNDLARGRLAWLGAWLIGHLLTRSRYTRHDAPLSVRRAYTAVELHDLLRSAGLQPVAHLDGFLAHRYAIVAVRGASGPVR